MTVADSNEPVARNIKHIIEEKGLKHFAVADKAGYTPGQFCSMLKGRKMIKPSDIVRVAEALEISEGELFKKGDE